MIELVPIETELDATRILYEMLRERSLEDDPFVNISHRALPPWEQHAAYVKNHIYRAWYLILADGEYKGQIYATKLNEIGIIILRAHRGKGWGARAVRELTAIHDPLAAIPGFRAGKWLANINPKNERSIRMFTGLGFTLKQHTYEL